MPASKNMEVLIALAIHGFWIYYTVTAPAIHAGMTVFSLSYRVEFPILATLHCSSIGRRHAIYTSSSSSANSFPFLL